MHTNRRTSKILSGQLTTKASHCYTTKSTLLSLIRLSTPLLSPYLSVPPPSTFSCLWGVSGNSLFTSCPEPWRQLTFSLTSCEERNVYLPRMTAARETLSKTREWEHGPDRSSQAACLVLRHSIHREVIAIKSTCPGVDATIISDQELWCVGCLNL